MTLLVIIYRLTNYVKIESTNQTARMDDIIILFHCSSYGQFELSHSIISNRHKLFISKFWKELYRILDIKIKLSTSCHPKIESSSKRSNKTIILKILKRRSKNDPLKMRTIYCFYI